MDAAQDALAAVPRRVKRAVKLLDEERPTDALVEVAMIRSLLDAVDRALGQERLPLEESPPARSRGRSA